MGYKDLKKVVNVMASLVLLCGVSANGFAQSGSAAGANSADSNPKLEYCEEPLGTLAVDEDQRARWWGRYYRRYPTLGSTVPVLRLMIQQSNCFVVVFVYCEKRF